MPRIQHLEKVAIEGSSYPIKFTFRDATRAIIPAAALGNLYWWLTDMSGNIVNERSQVLIEVVDITNPLYLVLNNSDTQLTVNTQEGSNRILTFKGTYSSNLGDDIPFVRHFTFGIIGNIIIGITLNVSIYERSVVFEVIDV